MNRVLAFLSSVLAAATLLFAASAEARPFHGPGSPGFLSTCAGTFNYSNDLLNTNSFGSGFATAGLGAAAPTLVANNAAGPDGSANTASTLTVPAVAASTGNYSQLYQQVLRTWRLPTSASVWAKVVSGGSNGKLYLEMTDGTNYNSTPITADGNWHQISFFVPASAYSATTVYFVIGNDQRDAKQTATTGTIVLNLYHPQLVNRRGPGGKPWPYVASGASAGSQTVTLACPRSIAFRDFRALKPFAGNPVTSPDPAKAYEAGGVAHFMPNQKVGGLYYAWGFSTNLADHNQWPVFNLYSGPSPFKMTEMAGNPILRIPGSTDTGTRGTVAGLSYYLLHPSQGPTGCTVSATFHPYCYYFSAMNTANHSGIYMAFGDSVMGPFTWYPNNTSPSELFTREANTNGPYVYPSLPSVIRNGGKNYMFTSALDNSGTYTEIFSSPITDGVNWTWESIGIQPPVAGDWNTDTVGTIDSFVHKNKCGFYEYFTTDQRPSPSRQEIGYAVSDDLLGPWYKYQGPIITNVAPSVTAPLYAGTPYYGDVTVTEYQGQFVITGNYDDGVGTVPAGRSAGVAASVRDACV